MARQFLATIVNSDLRTERSFWSFELRADQCDCKSLSAQVLLHKEAVARVET